MNKWSLEWYKYIHNHMAENWSWCALSENPNLTWNTVMRNQHAPWVFGAMSKNPNITWDIVVANLHLPWDYQIMSENPNLTWDIIVKHPRLNWDYELLSAHPAITWPIIVEHQLLPWCWYNISRNPNITWDIICANPNPQYEWNMKGFSRNPNFRIEFIKIRELRYDWDYYALAQNPAISLEDKKKYQRKLCWINDMNINNIPNLDWEYLREYTDYWKYGRHPAITWDIVMAHTDMPWKHLSQNPNISWDIVDRHTNETEWCFLYLSTNTFEKERYRYIENAYRRHFMEHIHPELMSVIWHPDNIARFHEWGEECAVASC